MNTMHHPDPTTYLGPAPFIDSDHAEIIRQGHALAGASPIQTAQNCFEFVRDEIRHSSDFEMGPITCLASEVLKHGTGFCYAKSHLLCALLRVNQIPSGLCYQRLLISAESNEYCLHGLNAIFLDDFGWYRVDPRGNRAAGTSRDGTAIDAQFCPPKEQLAFPIVESGEIDLPEIHAEPLPIVVRCLQDNVTWQQVCANLPDTAQQADPAKQIDRATQPDIEA